VSCSAQKMTTNSHKELLIFTGPFETLHHSARSIVLTRFKSRWHIIVISITFTAS